MFGKPSKRKRKRLEETGVRTMAEVLDVDHSFVMTYGVENVVADNDMDVRVTLRLKPEGQEPVEVKARMRFPQLSVPSPGLEIPVIYDPADPSEVIYDDSSGAISTMLGGDPSLTKLADMAMGGASEQELIDAASGMFPGATMIPGGQGAGMAAAQPAGDPQVADLERLAALHDSGALTDEEYAAAKARVLGDGQAG